MLKPGDNAPKKLKVFISYSRKDLAFAERIVSALEARGLAPKIDLRDLPKLEDWRRELLGFIEEADAVVFIVSPNSVSSPVCEWEVQQVAALNKRLAPIVIETVPNDRIPEAAAKINYLFFDVPEEFEVRCDALAHALETDHTWLKDHTRLGDLARRWDQQQRKSSALLRGQDLEDAEYWIASRPRNAPEPTVLHRALIEGSRRAAKNRQRSLVAGSLTAAVFGLGLASIAVWQRQIAVDESRRANANFSAAKRAADGLITDLTQSLRDVRGVPQDATRTLLSAAEAVMNQLVANTSSTPEIVQSRIDLYYQFGLTYWYVGDIRSALAYQTKSLDLGEALLNSEAGASLADFVLDRRYRALIEKGNILRVLGDLETSLETFQKAEVTAETIVERKPEQDKKAWQQVESVYGRIGDVMRTSGRFDEAERNYKEAERIHDRFLDKTHNDADWLAELSWSCNRQADNLLHITNHEGLTAVAPGPRAAFAGNPNLPSALAIYEKGLGIRRQLLVQKPNDKRNLRDLVWSLALTGMASLARDTAKAKTYLDEGLDIVGHALEEDAKNTELLRYQALLYNFSGDYFLIEGHAAEAFAAYETGLAIRQRLTEIDPYNARWQRDLFYTLARRAALYRIAGNLEASEGDRARALQIFERVRIMFPTDAILADTAARLKEERG